MRKLLEPYEVVADPDSTRSRIILESAKMFALSGYSAVSVRDIAKEIGIRQGSIYTHFSSKQEILNIILERCINELRDFYNLLDELSATAESFSDILNNIFAEPKETTNPFSYYAIWCAMNTQFEFEMSRYLYYDVFFVEGHRVMRRQMEVAIERGLVPKFNVYTVSSLITNSILMMVGFQVGRLNGFYEDFDIPEWYSRQISHILRVTGLKDSDA